MRAALQQSQLQQERRIGAKKRIHRTHRWLATVAYPLFACCLASCLPATQTIIELDADETLRRDGQSLFVRITGPDGVVLDRTLTIDEDWRWPTSIPVSPITGDADRRFRLEASLTSGEDQVSIRASLGFANSRQFRVRFEFVEACLGVQCGPGFSCVGGECVSSFINPRPDQCDLAEGEACDPQSQCGCPSGFACRDSPLGATCVAPACQTSEECDAQFAGFLCDYESGHCIPRANAVCTMPPPEREGPQLAGEACDAAQFCMPGLVCVPSVRVFDVDTASHPLQSTNQGGTCRQPCNPCEGCGDETCIALPSGGFCAGLGLSGPGEICGQFSGWRQECAGEAACVDGRCVTACTPALELARSGETGSASLSADCQGNEVCTRGSDAARAYWLCREDHLAEIGEFCNSNVEVLCAYPGLCVSDGGPIGYCNQSRDGCGDCPDGTHCRTFDWGEVCIRENALPRGVACANDLDCEGTFRCMDRGGVRQCG